MKILHILDHSLPLHSGYTFRSQNIFREQKKRGWEPVIVTSPKHEESWKKPTNSMEEINGFRYYRTGTLGYPRIPVIQELGIMYRLSRRIEQVAREELPDILHAHSPVLNAIPALWVGWRMGIPVVYEIRAFWEDAAVDHRTYAENSRKYRLVRSLETWACRKANHVAILCEGLKKDLIQRGIPADKVTVVYNGVNPEDFSPKEPDQDFRKAWNLDGKKVIGFIGSFYRYEGLDLLVKAFQHLASQHPNIMLLLVGGGEMESELKQLIYEFDKSSELPGVSSSQRLCDRIIFPGRIANEKIPSVYALVDVLAYPRYSMRLTELVTPLKPLEAMAMGKALVASDVGGHKELIRHNQTGLLFPAGDASALAASLTRLLQDEVLRLRLQSLAKTWVQENHTWEKTTRLYREMYNKALP